MSGPDAAMPFPAPEELLALARASLDANTPWEIAIHEAGHAVALMSFDEDPASIHINDDPADQSHAGRTTLARSLRHAIDYEQEAAFVAAGDVATRLAFGWEHDPAEVADLAEVILDDGGESKDQIRLAELTGDVEGIEEAYLRAESILRSRWPIVEAFACELIARRRLSGQELYDLWETMTS